MWLACPEASKGPRRVHLRTAALLVRRRQSGTGQLRLLSNIPDRSKQHGRRLPLASMSQAFAIRPARVAACLAETIQKMKSRRAAGVMSDHASRALAPPTP